MNHNLSDDSDQQAIIALPSAPDRILVTRLVLQTTIPPIKPTEKISGLTV